MMKIHYLSDNFNNKLIFFSLLYFSQGIPWGFISTSYPIFLLENGFSKQQLSILIAYAFLPWSLKFFFGFLIDRFRLFSSFGKRYPYIFLSQLLMSLSFLPVLLNKTGKLDLLITCLFIHNCFASIQDCSTDALAIDILTNHERGRANGYMWLFRTIGIFLGGTLGTIIANALGWKSLILFLFIILFIVTIILIKFRERANGTNDDVENNLSFSFLFRQIATPITFLGIAFALFCPSGHAMFWTNFPSFLHNDLNLSSNTISLLRGTIEPIFNILGAILIGYFVDKYGIKRLFPIILICLACILLFFNLINNFGDIKLFLIFWTACYSLLVSAFNIIFLSFLMSISNPIVGATQFSIFMSMGNLSYAITSPIGGYIFNKYGFSVLAYIGSSLQFLSIFVFIVVFSFQLRRKLQKA